MEFSDIASSHLLSFIVTSILVELTPGPNMVYLAILSLSEGWAVGYAATLGVALGLIIVGMASAFGLAAVVAKSPVLYQILRYGVRFICCGWRIEGAGSFRDAR